MIITIMMMLNHNDINNNDNSNNNDATNRHVGTVANSPVMPWVSGTWRVLRQ